MAVTKKSGRAVVDLVPWDHESKEHIQRLIEQRIACKWDAEYVEGPWVEEQRAGDKCIYWLVSHRLYKIQERQKIPELLI